MTEPARKLSQEEQLVVDIGSFHKDPMGYIMYAWPWGSAPIFRVCKMPEPWASRYQSEYGLDGWACEFIEDLEAAIIERGFNPSHPQTVMPVQMAVRSGHGIGKSALVGMLVSMIMDTRVGSRGRITANTGPQLHSTTWPQIKRWKSNAITAHWWDIQESRILHVRGEKYGRCDAVTWKKENSEAFAGQHEFTASSFYVNDEASAIHDKIWEVQSGGLTDGEPFRFAFGNPTRNVGEFHRAFGKLRHRWVTRQVDSRTVQITNKELINQWVEDYGLDSDYVRVRVLGKEPKGGENQLIPAELVRKAQQCEIPLVEDDEAVVMAIDCARSPLGDESVIFVRRGRDARTFGFKSFRGIDTHQLGSQAAEWFDHLRTIGHPPQVIFVDGGGLGAGTLDRLIHLGYPAVEVLFGGQADTPHRFKQKDAEMWVRTKAWLESGGALPEDEQLEEQLTTRPYDHTDDNRKYLWPKEDCKRDLGIESPDRADALCATFAFNVDRVRTGADACRPGRCLTDHDPYANV